MGDEAGPDLDAARRGLERKRTEILGTLASMRETRLGQSMGDGLSELSLYDNHPADIGTEMWQRSQQFAVADTLSGTLEDIDAALLRCAGGSYGLCTECERPIPVERLRAMPEAARCIDCQRAVEAAREAAPPHTAGRPVEEDVLAPPFARTWDDDTDRVGFDGEDAWQAVARFGTSNTPSDVPGARRYPHVLDGAPERHGAVEDVENLAAADGSILSPADQEQGDR